MYFEECSLVKSHKLDEVIRKHYLTSELMADPQGPDGDNSQENVSDC